MKWFYLIGVLLLAAAWVQAEEESDGLQDITKGGEDSDEVDIKEAIKELFTKKCESAGGKDLVERATTAIDTAKACLGEHAPKNRDELKDIITDDSSSSEELCSDHRPKLRKCFADFIDVLKECSHEEEKYLPEFVFDALDAVFDYVCADDGAVILKIFNDETLECVFKLADHDNITDVCEDKYQFLKDDTPEDAVITKPELCSDLSTAKQCYIDFIKQECPGDHNLVDLVSGIYGAVSSPCQKDAKNPLKLNVRRRK